MSATSWSGAPRQAPATGRTVRGLRLQIRVLWLFIEPLLLAGAIATIKWAADFGRTYGNIPVFIFSLVSYLPYFAFRSIAARAPGTLRANMTLLYHSSIKLIDTVLARHALEMAAVLAVMALICVGVALYGDTPPEDIPLLLGGLVLLFLWANGIGLIFAAGAAVSDVFERLIHPIIYVALPLSGALVPLARLDPLLREVLLWNPQAHIHEMVREGFFGSQIPSFFDVGYVLFWVGMVNLIGLAALRVVRPRLEF